jgi:hypothetical protein
MPSIQNYFRIWGSHNSGYKGHCLLEYNDVIQATIFLVLFLTLKMEAIYSSETSVDFQQTTRRYIPEDSTLQTDTFLKKNLKKINIHIPL